MEPDNALMIVILPVTYIIVDLMRPIPGIRDWALPIIAAVVGMLLGVLWALAGDTTSGEQIMIHAAIGFGFGAGATGSNQIKRQAENRETA